MKALFFLILLANAAVFMWEYKTGALVGHENEVEPMQDLEPIRLVGESVTAEPQPFPGPTLTADASGQEGRITKPQAQATNQIPSPPEQPRKVETEDSANVAPQESQPAESSVASAKSEVPSENLCYEAGPFATDADYQTWSKQLPFAGSDLRPVYKDGRVVSSYLVYFPAGDTDEQAKENIKLLKEKGITDLWLIRKGEDAGLISLALFKGETRAQVMKEELKQQKAIDAQIKPKYVPGKVRYVQIKISVNDSNALKSYIAEPLTMTQIDCW